jgi:CRP/FNR family transcriptional regulator, dissimilatory nitrate respiration regulator
MITIMSDPILDLFATDCGRGRKLEAASFLFHEGDLVKNVFLVMEGEIQLVRNQQSGLTVVLQRAGQGSVVAEASVFSQCYHCAALVRTTANVRSVARDEFLREFQANPEFARAWAKRLAKEVQASRLRSEILSLKTVAERLDAWLAWHGELPAKGEWNQIALQTGVSAEALYREISKRKKLVNGMRK